MKKNNLLVAIALLSVAACAKVPAGYVAVKVDAYGSDRGVQNDVVGPGMYFAGFNTTYFKFPTFSQNYTWTRSSNEGKAADESISFQTKDGVSVNADFGITYHIDRSNVAQVFQKYRQGVDEITDVYLRNMVRDSLNEVAGTMSLDDLNSDKSKFMTRVNTSVIKKAIAAGITVESISAIGSFRYPPNITQAMNAKMQATQDAMRVQNEVLKTQAEAKKAIVKSEADVTVATNEAKATAIRGEALSKNPEVLQQMWIEKWDGHQPQVVGGGTPMINLPHIVK